MSKDKTIKKKPQSSIHDIQLRELNLQSCNFFVNKNLSKGSGTFSINSESSGDVRYNDQGSLEGLLATNKFVLLGKNKDDEDVISAEVTFVSEYYLVKPIKTSDEEIQDFFDNIPLTHIWPYARETIDWLTRMAGLKGVILPVIVTHK